MLMEWIVETMEGGHKNIGMRDFRFVRALVSEDCSWIPADFI